MADWYMTEERQLIVNAVREYVETEVKPAIDKMEIDDEYPHELMDRAAELGFYQLLFPPEVGGVGPDHVAQGLMIEEISKESFTLAVLIATLTGMAMSWIYEAGTPEQIEKYVIPAMKGEIKLGMSHTEPVGLFNWFEHQTRAKLDGDHYILNGGKIFTTSAGECEAYLVGTVTSDPDPATMSGYSQFIVDADIPGFEVGHIENKLGMHGSRTGSLNYRNMRIPKENLLGNEGEMGAFLGTHMTSEWAGAGAMGLGVAEGIYEKVMKYTKERVQMGQTLWDAHESMRDKFAEMWVEIEALRYLVYSTLTEINEGNPDDRKALACKIMGSNVAEYVASECLNMCGGHGTVVENGWERYFRDAKVMKLAGGAHNTIVDTLSMFL